MSDRLFNGKDPAPRGGLDLTGRLHHSRLREILDASLKAERKPPTISFPVDITVEGKPSEMPVGPIKRFFDDAYWGCVEKVRGIGFDPDSGEFSIVNGPTLDVGQGKYRVVCYVQWAPRKATVVT